MVASRCYASRSCDLLSRRNGNIRYIPGTYYEHVPGSSFFGYNFHAARETTYYYLDQVLSIHTWCVIRGVLRTRIERFRGYIFLPPLDHAREPAHPYYPLISLIYNTWYQVIHVCVYHILFWHLKSYVYPGRNKVATVRHGEVVNLSPAPTLSRAPTLQPVLEARHPL